MRITDKAWSHGYIEVFELTRIAAWKSTQGVAAVTVNGPGEIEACTRAAMSIIQPWGPEGCAFLSEYAAETRLVHPKSVCLREEQLLPQLTSWMNETQAKRTTAQARLNSPTGRRRMTRDEIASLVRAVGGAMQVIKDADPADKPRSTASLA
jgi:hypothetical protein